MIRSFFAIVLVFVFASFVVAQTPQSSPEKMTGKLFVNGKPSGTAFLVGDRVILTNAHCLYNPTGGQSRRDYEVVFCPGASKDAQGRWITPHGSYRGVMPMGFLASWWTEATRIGLASSEEAKKIIAHDWAVITLDRSPRLGYFDLAAELNGHYIAKTEGVGYPAFEKGRQFRRKVDIAMFDLDKNLVTMEEVVALDWNGMSGAPYFFKADNGRWTAYAIHGWSSGLSKAHEVHRRITPEIRERIRKFNSESGELAMR